MSKTEKKNRVRWTWRDYALQLSVVIIGVMVTFVGSDLIGRWSRQRQVKTVMQLVVDELKINRVQVQKVCRKLRFDRNGMLMLQRYEMDLGRIPGDSLNYYFSIIGATESLRPHVDALEVLKTSGTISSVTNKQLLLDLLSSYNRIQNFSTDVENYNRRKISAQDHLFASNADFVISGDDSRSGWNAFFCDPVCAAFLGCMAYYFGFEDRFDDHLTDIDRTITAINQEYGLE